MHFLSFTIDYRKEISYPYAIPTSVFPSAEQVASTNVQVCNDITSGYPEGVT